jgi:hypothetical protein
MNAFRKSSVLVLVAFVAVLALGLVSSAEAGGCHSGGYGYSTSYSHYPSSYNCYGNSCYYPTSNYYPTTSYYPTTYSCYKPVCYPVTTYDCYGHPSTVWQTSYTYQP